MIRDRISQSMALSQQDKVNQQKLERKLDESRIDQNLLSQCVSTLNDLQEYRADESDSQSVQATVEDPIELLFERCHSLETGIMQSLDGLRSSAMWASNFQKRADKHGSCACCDRKMNEAERNVYNEKIKKFFKGTPETLAEYQQMFRRSQELTKTMKDLKLLIDLNDSSRKEIDEIKQRIASLDSSLIDMKATENNVASRVDRLETSKASHEKCLNDLVALSKRWDDLYCRKNEISALKNRQSQSLSYNNGDRSLLDREDDQRQRSEERDEMHRKKENAQNEEKRITEQMYNLKSKQGEAEKSFLEAKVREEKAALSVSRMIELDRKKKLLEDEKSVLSRELMSAERIMVSKEKEFNETKSEAAKIEREKSDFVAELRQDFNRLEVSSKILKDMEQKVSSLNVRNVNGEIDSVQTSIQEKEDSIRELNPKIQSTRSELEKSDRLKRLILENLNFRALKKEEVVLSNKLHDVSEKAGGKDLIQEYNDAQRRLQRADQEKQKLVIKQAEIKGSIGEILNQIGIYEKKLCASPYKDIDEHHRMANIKYETTMLAVADLDSYFFALDRALQTYHSLKMKDINKVIRELWQQIYRGEDIDMIELVSGQDAAGAEGKAVRSYNYRVMMYKGDTCLEMRGRCSAGQRVLASTVIRLALAETFCLNCGILALDEVRSLHQIYEFCFVVLYVIEIHFFVADNELG